jgi:hypothetical protein
MPVSVGECLPLSKGIPARGRHFYFLTNTVVGDARGKALGEDIPAVKGKAVGDSLDVGITKKALLIEPKRGRLKMFMNHIYI